MSFKVSVEALTHDGNSQGYRDDPRALAYTVSGIRSEPDA